SGRAGAPRPCGRALTLVRWHGTRGCGRRGLTRMARDCYPRAWVSPQGVCMAWSGMSAALEALKRDIHRRLSLLLKASLLLGVGLGLWNGQYQAAAETSVILVVTFLPLVL